MQLQHVKYKEVSSRARAIFEGIRHQADMKLEIAARLAAITVDPKTVKLAR